MNMPTVEFLTGDCLEMLKTFPDESVHCVVTSPPYWGLRDYGVAGQLGLEKTPEEYVARMVEVFREVRRVLRSDGTCWVNLGDSYAAGGRGGGMDGPDGEKQRSNEGALLGPKKAPLGLKPKDMVGIPWRVAFALQADGWWLRSEITWCKKAPMPESVMDRPTSSTEKIFLLTKSSSYWYDADAVRNPPSESMIREVEEGYNGNALKLFDDASVQNASSVKSRIIENARKKVDKQRGHSRKHAGFNDRWDHMTKTEQMAFGSNMRNYWLLGNEPVMDNHFATFPTEIPRRCILAGCPIQGTVLDPFCGSGTTGMVSMELGRNAILIDLNPKYIELARKRCHVTPGFCFGS